MSDSGNHHFGRDPVDIFWGVARDFQGYHNIISVVQLQKAEVHLEFVGGDALNDYAVVFLKVVFIVVKLDMMLCKRKKSVKQMRYGIV